jgi:cardiolipin synthase (CMP-forming)
VTSEQAEPAIRNGALPSLPSTVPANRVLTVPNVMSIIRLACIPLFLYLLFGRDNVIAAAFLLGGLGATDWVDGYVARHFNQVSELGKVLDPTADRLMFIVSLISIIIYGAGPAWFYWLVLVREVAFGAAVFLATLAGMKRFDVTWWGKAATFLLMFAIPGLMLGSADWPPHMFFHVVSLMIGIPALIISYATALAYIPVIRRNLREGRLERSSRAPAA